MKVKFQELCEADFIISSYGSTFIDRDYDEDTVLMCVRNGDDIILGTDTNISTNYDGYAVNIQTGEIKGYHNYDKVIFVKAETTVLIG